MTTTRVKLEIPTVDDTIREVLITELINRLKEHNIELTCDEEEKGGRVMEEVGCEKYVEVNYQMSCVDYEEHLLKAIRHYLKYFTGNSFPEHHNKPSIILNSQECFSDSIECAFMNQSVAAVYFGNIQGGICLSHWEISYVQNDKYHTEGAIRADFEFDLNDIIKINFENSEFRRTNIENTEDGEKDIIVNNKRTNGTCYYQLLIKRKTIRRLIVDPCVSDKFGSNRTRLHFELNAPVSIKQGFIYDNRKNKDKVNMMIKPRMGRFVDIKRGRNESEFPNRLALADSPIFTIELSESVDDETVYSILSRLKTRLKIPIEFASITIVDCLWGKDSPYHKWLDEFTKEKNREYEKLYNSHNQEENYNYKRHRIPKPTDVKAPLFSVFLSSTFKSPPYDGSNDNTAIKKKLSDDQFIVHYLIEALLSRGAIVKDQLLLQEECWTTFLHTVEKFYHTHAEACIGSLERLVSMIDEGKRMGFITKAFIREFEMQHTNRVIGGITAEEIREGFVRVCKVTITPTRVIYVVPETIMSNRVIRQCANNNHILRLALRDDDNDKMRSQKTSDALIERTVNNAMWLGINVAGCEYAYLGSSNSQMRDHGQYLMLKAKESQVRKYLKEHKELPPLDYIPHIKNVRSSLGNFTKMKNIPKMMARLGQCFTQSMEANVEITAEQHGYTYDIIGGSDPKNEAFTFSDGTGLISRRMAEKIANDRGLSYVPSIFQFRLRGLKGVVIVEETLDELREWATNNNIPIVKQLDLLFRQSQNKFQATWRNPDLLEVVKCSAPVPVALNKPFINILDQVSEKQSFECHQRMCNRIHELLDRQMKSFHQILSQEHQCRNKLKELPRRIDIDQLSQTAGFTLSNEPFFRSMLTATVKYSLTKNLRKQQIGIPYDLGRSLLGSIDGTGRLQYGQIFIQVTKNVNGKPTRNSVRKVITGKVLVTKNPCVTEGDVRVFDAIDIPELHGQCDVIIFPQYGPRPHPDEMAGSDLDGDEYSAIWDPLMLLERNEAAFDFSCPKREDEEITEDNMDKKMREFYIKYMTQDSVGKIANAFLFQSDLFGINSKVCLGIAKKNSQAVDFTKTGEPPEPLIAEWTTDENGEDVPPEKPERVPDFHQGNDYEPVYISPRLIGRIHREIKQVEDALLLTDENDGELNIIVDEHIAYEGWKEYEALARTELAKYNTVLRNIMDNYAIRSEGEIFSGKISEMRNRISDRDQDDMSSFNTDIIIENKMNILFKETRQNFFEEFGDWKNCTTKSEKTYADENNIFHRSCNNPSDKMKRKATAFYRICYEEAIRTREKKLSFAWVAYDILAAIKQEAVLNLPDFIPTSNPLERMLSEFIPKYCENNQAKFDEFLKFSMEQFDPDCVGMLRLYCTVNEGLSNILFILCEWAEAKGIINETIRIHHICLIAIIHAISYYPSGNISKETFVSEIRPGSKIEDFEDTEKLAKPAPLLISLFEYLASRKFRTLTEIDFGRLGYEAVFLRQEWEPIHNAAVSTFYGLVFHLNFAELSLSEIDGMVPKVIREFEPFVIELPETIDEDRVRCQLIIKSGISQLKLRRREGMNRGRVSITCQGTRESFYTLRELVAVKPPLNYASRGKEFSKLLGQLVYEKIMAD